MKTILFKPFEVYSEKKLLIVGISLTLIGSFLGFLFNTGFYGNLKVLPLQDISFLQVFLDNLLIVFVYTLLLFLAAKYINRKTRLIDILTTTMIARTPLYFLVFANINGFMFLVSERLKEQLPTILNAQNAEHMLSDNFLFVLLFGFVSILFMIWFIALLYNGFKIGSNAKETKGIIVFSLAIIVAEILSRIFIYHLNRFIS